MAGGAIINHVEGKHYPGKITIHVFLTCLMAATSGLLFGYDVGISGGVTSMDSFLIKFFSMVYRKEKGETVKDLCYLLKLNADRLNIRLQQLQIGFNNCCTSTAHTLFQQLLKNRN